MKILVLNCGSTSLKYQLINMKDQSVCAKGAFEKIGYRDSFYSHVAGTEKVSEEFFTPTHEECVKKLFELLGDQVEEVFAIGHRVVHGGEKYMKSTLVTDDVLAGVEAVSGFAPLHNPANLLGVRACMTVMQDVPNVLVFDTAFHSTLPKHAYLYAIPMQDYRNYGIRRYGFHGTSYAYVSREVAKKLNKSVEELRIVAMHLGGGASICAIDKGISVEVSMGLTPLEGLVMGTRSGDIDPGAVAYLAKIKGWDAEQVVDYLNKNSGIAGLSTTGSADMRDLLKNKETIEEAQIAFDSFIHRLKKYMGAYVAVMGGVDAFIWTAGIGTNTAIVREKAMECFAYLGAEIDKEKNQTLQEPFNGIADISKRGSKVKTFVVATNEELEIALETKKIVESV